MPTRPLAPALSLVALAATALIASPLAAQTTIEWITGPNGLDLRPARTVDASRLAASEKGLATIDREPVRFGWSLDPAAPLDLAARPPREESRELWLEVTAAELEKGVPLFTTAPRAVVRLNPRPGADPGVAAKAAIDPASLVLVDAVGRAHRDGRGMETLASAEKLAEAGVPFAAGTSAFRVAAGLGAGPLTLKAERLPPSADRYVLHVFEPESELVVVAATSRDVYLDGDRLRVSAASYAGERALVAAAVDGYVTSPAGRAFPLRFAAGRDGWAAELVLDAREAPAPGLWEAHLAAHGEVDGKAWMRSARVAFAVALPTARFDGRATVGARAADGALRPALGVEVGTAGRYEARGVLYATGPGGELRAVAVAHAAAWLEPGARTLALAFDAAPAGFGRPYEVRDLRLVDQSRMAVLHRQESALHID